MEQLEDKYKKLLLEIHAEWNKSERCIKQAEQVNHAVVFPAIKELRYAGRRLIDALHLILTHSNGDDAMEFLYDAKFDCNRARHDAIDALVSKVAIDLEMYVRSTSPKAMLAIGSTYTDLFKSLNKVRGKIADSRERRNSRNHTYEEIEAEDIDSIINSYLEIKGSEQLLRQATIKEKMYRNLAFASGIAGVILAMLFEIKSYF